MRPPPARRPRRATRPTQIRLLHLSYSTASSGLVFYIQPPSTYVAHHRTTCSSQPTVLPHCRSVVKAITLLVPRLAAPPGAKRSSRRGDCNRRDAITGSTVRTRPLLVQPGHCVDDGDVLARPGPRWSPANVRAVALPRTRASASTTLTLALVLPTPCTGRLGSTARSSRRLGAGGVRRPRSIGHPAEGRSVGRAIRHGPWLVRLSA